MASIIGKTAGKITKEINKLQASPINQGPLNKVWRLMILANRASSPMEKVPAPWQDSIPVIGGMLGDTEYQKADKYNKHYTQTESAAQRADPWQNQVRYVKQTGLEDRSPFAVDYIKGKSPTVSTVNNKIIIINRNVSPAVSLELQNRPSDISIEPKSNWATVKSMGRNNAFEMYTGGEDSISLEISWYATDEVNRDDVVNKCKLLESWTKADGYNAAPPTLELIWGSSGIFKNDKFILVSAPYKLCGFQNAARGITSPEYPRGEIIDLKLLPNYATQILSFKRVTDGNRTHKEIVDPEVLKRTPGVTFEVTSNP